MDGAQPAEAMMDLLRKRGYGGPQPPPDENEPKDVQEEKEREMTRSQAGHLVVDDEGKSRYVNPQHWAAISDEVENLKVLLDEQEDEEDGPELPHRDSSPAPFFLRSTTDDIGWKHPSTEEGQFLWRQYCIGVDPLIPILHKPSFERLMCEWNGQRLLGEPTTQQSRSVEALMFGVWYAAVGSMHPGAVKAKWPSTTKRALQIHYREALEQSLVKNRFMESEDLITLQAFLLFISCMRGEDEIKMASGFVGMAIRIAKSLGLHRDGSLFPEMKPIEREVRRRVWYEICLQDLRTAEELGIQPCLLASSYDTYPPTNIDDRDLTAHSCKASDKWTEMTFFLVRIEMFECFRSLIGLSVSERRKTCFEKIAQVEELRTHIFAKYLEKVDKKDPIQFCTGIIAELLLARALLYVYHPIRHGIRGALLTDEIKNKLFIYAIENLEGVDQLALHPGTQNWSWFFRSYYQAHALALLFLELSIRPPCPLAFRAWAAVDKYLAPGGAMSGPEQKYWRPLKKLRERAWKTRASYAYMEVPAAAATAAAAHSVAASVAKMPGIDERMTMVHPLPQMIDGNIVGTEPIDWQEWDTLFDFGAPERGAVVDGHSSSTAHSPWSHDSSGGSSGVGGQVSAHYI
ncbi:hypothetical protein EDC01DRAFT_632722 [Geopyxis carbonaria]|nr:hypothetical protein EDC01DRAFT_632722 [Geopyxis carbonaria]